MTHINNCQSVNFPVVTCKYLWKMVEYIITVGGHMHYNTLALHLFPLQQLLYLMVNSAMLVTYCQHRFNIIVVVLIVVITGSAGITILSPTSPKYQNIANQFKLKWLHSPNQLPTVHSIAKITCLPHVITKYNAYKNNIIATRPKLQPFGNVIS